MNDDYCGKSEGVITGMLRSLEGEQTGSNSPAVLVMETEAVQSDNTGGDEVLELH